MTLFNDILLFHRRSEQISQPQSISLSGKVNFGCLSVAFISSVCQLYRSRSTRSLYNGKHGIIFVFICFSYDFYLILSFQLFNVPIHILISYSLSFITFLFIEMPVIQFLKTVFQRRTNSPNQKRLHSLFSMYHLISNKIFSFFS